MRGFCPLASGSKGNSIFFGTDQTRLLIDAGGSFLSLQKRLQEINVSIDTIDAVLVTHEHTDHIQALALLAKKHNIPIFANAETAKAIISSFKDKNLASHFKIFSTGEPFCFADLEIHPFSIPHDTLDPVAFTIYTQSHKIGFCADLGYVTSLVQKELQECDYLYLEANHQVSMVHSSHRPMVYKERVLGKQGHLSNQECADLLMKIMHPKLKHVHLAHLSSECNLPEIALQIVSESLQKIGALTELSIAHQDKVSKAISL